MAAVDDLERRLRRLVGDGYREEVEPVQAAARRPGSGRFSVRRLRRSVWTTRWTSSDTGGTASVVHATSSDSVWKCLD